MDNVNSPKHYTQGHIETIYAIEKALGPEGFRAYCMGNWIKYSSRHKEKGGAEDLAKAEVYLGWAVNGLPTPVNGKLPTETTGKRKFAVGDRIKRAGGDSTVFRVVNVDNNSYVIETVSIKTRLYFQYEWEWEKYVS